MPRSAVVLGACRASGLSFDGVVGAFHAQASFLADVVACGSLSVPALSYLLFLEAGFRSATSAVRLRQCEGDLEVTAYWTCRQAVMDANGEYAGQCGATGAARMVQDAGVEKLVLVHIGPHLSAHGPMEHGIGDISRIYNGEVIFSEELMRISL